MKEIKGLVSGIKRMEIHDGEGLRTTVFFKGCPLECIWCHNPESIGYKKQTAFFTDKCIGCGSCYTACKNGAVKIGGGIEFEKCVGCGECAEICPTEALTHYGREYTPSELVSVLMEDALFFKNSGGGVTLSGGECLSQPEFAVETARLLKNNGVSVFIDTCGYIKREIIDEIIPYTDKFLYDIKAFSEETHIACTGRSNKLILGNLKYLSSVGARIEIRIPFVPELNGEEMKDIAELVSELNVEKVKILPYHNFALSRYDALGMNAEMPENMPSNEETDAVRRMFAELCRGVSIE